MAERSNKRRLVTDVRGFTLIELLIVVAIIGVLSAIAIPLFSNAQARARTAKAQADVRAIRSAVSMYLVHYGTIPTALGELTASGVNAQGTTVGPMLGGVPTTPAGWTPSNAAYAYVTGATDTFTISAAGDGATAKAP